ncbi:MAG: S26 family signal peptidase [Chlorobiaceae bacterium]|nr:S26 family signal peptidase [Chlorobiaceae bacterium]
MKRFRVLFPGLIFLALIIISSLFLKRKIFIYNYTESLPRGIYLLHPGFFKKGDIVAFRPSGIAARIIEERKYLGKGEFLMKHIVGFPGDSVCTDNGMLSVNGENFGGIKDVDRQGKPLPRYGFCGRLKEGYIVAIKGMNSSFDSRYYGPIKSENIIGVATPFWLFDISSR